MVHHYPMAFKAIRLDSGSGLSATFVPGAGMVIASLTFQGEEFLDQREGLGKYVESASTMGIPILYPWANRLARDSWKFGPQPARIDPGAYRVKRDENGLAIHGTLAASSLWEVSEARAEDDLGSASAKATLEFGAHPELLRTFPFPHRLELEFRLAGSKLSVRTTVTPTGDLAVPLAYGFHPYLTLPDSRRSDWTVRLPAMRGLETDSRHIPTGNTGAADAFEGPLEDREYDDSFSGVPEGAVFSIADHRRQLTVCFERGFRAAQVYSPADEDFICFEPMKAPTNALVSARELTSVRPGESDVAEFSISIGEPDSPPASDKEEPKSEGLGSATHVKALPKPDTDAGVGPETGTESAGPESTSPESARYRFDREDPVGSVRRVARGRVNSAVESLRGGASEDRPSAVHTARKDMKKMRSVLRLVRDELGKQTYREENRRYRDAARLLSAARDSEVMAGTLGSVLEDYPADGPPVEGLVRDLDQRRARASAEGEASMEATLGEAADRIEAGGRGIPDWPLESPGWQLFEPGLKHCYAAGRKDLSRVEKQLRKDRRPESEVMHDFRKRVKDLWYATRLVREAWPAGLEGPEEEADRLAELLGDYNDLSVLLEEIESRQGADGDAVSGRAEDLSVLVETIEDRQAGLLDDCLPIARRLYAEDPTAFTNRLGAYWSA
jgi:aldose 1-epimerase